MTIDRDKLLSISVKKVSRIPDLRDRQLSADLAAYKRLRRNGLQPPGVDGCAKLEKQGITELEITTGVVPANLSAPQRRELAKSLAQIEERPA